MTSKRLPPTLRTFPSFESEYVRLPVGARSAVPEVRGVECHGLSVSTETLRKWMLHIVRAYAREIVDVLAAPMRVAWECVANVVGRALVAFARERHPSRSRQRIALKLGAIGA